MESKVQPSKVPKLGYFYVVSFALLFNLIALMMLMRRHAYRLVSTSDDHGLNALADGLYRFLPHPAQMHNHAVATGQLDIWSREFSKFTYFAAIELGLVLFILCNIAIYYLFGYAKKAELALIEEYRDPMSLRKPLKPFTALIAISVMAGLAILTLHYLYFAPYNGSAYDEQFFGDILMCVFLLIWIIFIGALVRNALISRKAVRMGQISVPASNVSVAGIIKDKDNNPLQ